MISTSTLSALALVASSFISAAPTWGTASSYNFGEQQVVQTSDWAAGGVTEYSIHPSCNHSENALLRQALTEAEVLAAHARDHILRFGNSSSYYLKYFGTANSGEPAGWFDKVVRGDKAGVLFRCDDPDKNCATQDGANLSAFTYPRLLTSLSLGRPLARVEWIRRECYLRALVHSQMASSWSLRVRLHCSLSPDHRILRLRLVAPPLPHRQGWRGSRRTLRR